MADTDGEGSPPTAPGRHVSLSSLRCFRTCPRQWKYRYLDRAPEEAVSSGLLAGAALHAALAEMHRRLAAGFRPRPAELLPMFTRHWDLAGAGRPVRFARRESAGGISIQAVRLLDAYLADHAPRPRDILAVEFPVTLPAPAAVGAPVLGRLDLLLGSPEGPVVVEFKTGRMPLDARRSAEAVAQAALYASAVELAGSPPGRGRIVLLRRLRTPRIETAEAALGGNVRDRAVRTLAEDWRLLSAARRAGAFPARRSWSCDACPYALRCASDDGAGVGEAAFAAASEGTAV
jgi:hypothetical protein